MHPTNQFYRTDLALYYTTAQVLHIINILTQIINTIFKNYKKLVTILFLPGNNRNVTLYIHFNFANVLVYTVTLKFCYIQSEVTDIMTYCLYIAELITPVFGRADQKVSYSHSS